MIRVSHVSKHFGDFAALTDVTVDIPTGSLTALLGPSGGGRVIRPAVGSRTIR